MKVVLSDRAIEDLEHAPSAVQRAFEKHLRLLALNRHHPSLRTKKYQEAEGIWQARVNRDWRFYFNIAGDTYIIRDIIPHPK